MNNDASAEGLTGLVVRGLMTQGIPGMQLPDVLCHIPGNPAAGRGLSGQVNYNSMTSLYCHRDI